MDAPDGALIEIESWRGGDFWTVAGPNQWDRGVCLADEGSGTDFDGMFDAPVTTIYNATAFQVGEDFGGIREEKYDFALAFFVKGTSDLPWRVADSDFRRAFSYTKKSYIHVEVEESRRRLPVQLGGKPRIKSANDPNGEKLALVLMPLIGAYPRWIEDDIIGTYVTTTDTTASGSETGAFTWPGGSTVFPGNRCDVDVYPKILFQGTAGLRWTIPDYSHGNDEFDRATIDAARKITMTPTLAGEHVFVDVDPDAMEGQFNSSLDTEFDARMGGVRFMYKIPAETPLNPAGWPITAQHAPIGAGIQYRIPREWSRPWGME